MLKYDDVMNKQREVVYGYRNEVLSTETPRDLVIESSSEQLRRAGLPTIVALALLLLALLAVAPFAPIVAGLAMGAGATDLRSRSWITGDEESRGVTILRATTPLPFATSRAKMWVRASADQSA